MEETRDIILSFLRNTVDNDLQLDTPLIDGGLLDSFQVVELLSFLESEFNLRLEPTDLTHDDLVSAQSITELVARLRANAPASP